MVGSPSRLPTIDWPIKPTAVDYECQFYEKKNLASKALLDLLLKAFFSVLCVCVCDKLEMV